MAQQRALRPASKARKPQKPATPARARDADATRTRIIEAAKARFSHNSFEGVGVREIAADAGADPALVMRYFGSKEGLFREVAAHAFNTQAWLNGAVSALPERMADSLLGEVDEQAWRTGYDPLRLLLCSIGSPLAGPVLAEHLERDFIQPLAAALDGEQARERAAMLAAHVIGLAVMRVAVASHAGPALQREKLEQLLRFALAACVAPGVSESRKKR